jgi:hypothetical protein
MSEFQKTLELVGVKSIEFAFPLSDGRLSVVRGEKIVVTNRKDYNRLMLSGSFQEVAAPVPLRKFEKVEKAEVVEEVEKPVESEQTPTEVKGGKR